MTYLHEKIAEQVKGWREAGYPHDIYPAISEILDVAGGSALWPIFWFEKQRKEKQAEA